MKKGIKKKWLAALRSGEFTQGMEALRIGEKGHYEYCCLGVLCELHRKEHSRSWRFNDDGEAEYLGDPIALPKQVIEWSGLKEPDPIVPGTKQRLSALNDNGMSFTEIANLIEENL